MEKAPEIIILNATITYKNQHLFNALDLTLPAKQCTCLLGPSGVGKSSLLRLIAGLPIEADHTILEYETNDNQPLVGRMSYLSQQDALFPWLTALENIYVSYLLTGKKLKLQHKMRAKKILTELGLAGAEDKKPLQLSGGMRQRVALARVLFEDQPIVLLDEPFAAVDAIQRWQLQKLTMHLFRQKTLLWVTHDPLEALRVSHQIKILGGSPVRWVGSLGLTHIKPPVREFNQPEFLKWHTKLMLLLRQAVPEVTL